MSALIAGSLAPDFPYYLLLSTRYMFAHTLTGAVLAALPLGLAALWLFHVFLKEPLFYLLPAGLQARMRPYLQPYAFLPRQRLLGILLSLLLGIATHLAWDFLTHPMGPVFAWLPGLSKNIIDAGGFTLPVYKLLQHGSTLGGLALLLVWAFRWMKRGAPHNHSAPQPFQLSKYTKKWAGLGLISMLPVIALTGFSLPLAFQALHDLAYDDLRTLLVRAVLTFIIGMFLSVVGYSGWWHWMKRSRVSPLV